MGEGKPARCGWLVNAIAITVPDRSLKTSWLSTSTGRRPACSRPRVGSRSAHRTSPLSMRAMSPHPSRGLPPPAPVRPLGRASHIRRQGGDLQQALEFLQNWLLAETSGTLLARLRAAQLCRSLSVRCLYQQGAQALWLLSFAGVAEEPSARAELAAALQDWFGFFAHHAPWDELCERYRRIQACRPPARTPLALARQWQAALAQGVIPDQPLGAGGVQLLAHLLRQMHKD